MKRIMLSLLVFAVAGIPSSEAPKPPFSVSIVPNYSDRFGSGISMGQSRQNEFFVVLTNISQQTQPVFETWNSLGYQTISFELVTPEGKKYVFSKKTHGFDKNFPSTYMIKAGENQVYTICLDDTWETTPSLPEEKKMQVAIKAIYEVSREQVPDDFVKPFVAPFKVWYGRVESHSYNLTFYRSDSR